MLLSKTGRYALMATLEIARHSDRVEGAAEPARRAPLLRASELAAALDVPANYLAKILHQLARAGVLASERGPKGGFRLAGAPEDVSLEAVVAPVAPAIADTACLLGRPQCRDDDPCAAHARWSALNDEMRRFLQDTTVADLIDRAPAARAARPR